MKKLYQLWHSLVCGCHREHRASIWSGWPRLILPLMAAASLAWFLFRVIPKPIRATYPCQQAAFPLASSFVIWLLAVKAGALAFIRREARKIRAALIAAAFVLVSGLIAWGIGETTRNAGPAWTPSDPANTPMGVAQGIFPGRVVWIRDTNATPWNGNTNSGRWWDQRGTDQAAVDRMTSRSLQALTGGANNADAWNKLFRHHNALRGRGDAGYRPGEVIALKPNCNNAYAGYGDDDNQIDASPQVLIALLRQLVHEARVPQSNIVVYEAVRVIHDHIYAPCHAEFPGVIWVDSKGNGANGREPVNWRSNAFACSVTESNQVGTSVPERVFQSTYLINVALLKGHPTTGITLTAKNHYGSIDGRDHRNYVNTWQHRMGIYNPFVDLMGTKQLGGKTILYLIDGLYGTRDANDPVIPQFAAWSNLFEGQWSASLLMSQDPVAIDSVGLDFLRDEFRERLTRMPGHDRHADNYLHEAALANRPPSGTVYRPDGIVLESLGVHEHWNNPTNKQYSRNLSPGGAGIELFIVP